MTPTPDPRLTPFIAPVTASHAKFYPRGPFISITLAQLILESAWGTVTSGKNNFFGIKARLNAEGHPIEPATLRWTHETLHGIYGKIPQYFADYPDIESGIDAHAYLLCSPWYAACVNAATPDAYANALVRCHYATGIPGHPYDQALIGIMTAHNLYQYNIVPNIAPKGA